MEMLYQSLVSVNPVTLVAQIVNLFITLFVFKKFYWSKILNILDQRRAAADQQIADAQAARSEAMEIKASYEQNMRKSKEKADQLLLSAQQTAALRGEAIIQDAQRAAAAIKQKAQGDIALELKKARCEAKNEISEISILIAGKVLGRELTAADQTRLVDHFIDELGGQI